jgi:hypothetical protein
MIDTANPPADDHEKFRAACQLAVQNVSNPCGESFVHDYAGSCSSWLSFSRFGLPTECCFMSALCAGFMAEEDFQRRWQHYTESA